MRFLRVPSAGGKDVTINVTNIASFGDVGNGRTSIYFNGEHQVIVEVSYDAFNDLVFKMSNGS